jgi:ABC-type transport system involved in cytochrome bd biosynthesis fused ATPase/permease subunit
MIEWAGLRPSKVTGRIEFRNVAFAYPTRADEPVFTGMNLTVEPGQTVAIVGERYVLDYMLKSTIAQRLSVVVGAGRVRLLQCSSASMTPAKDKCCLTVFL